MAGIGFETGDPDGSVPRIVKTPDVLGGDPRIEDNRIGVSHVYQQYVDGDATPERIAEGYDITLAAVHAALAYAFSNPDEMRDIQRRNRELRECATPDRVVPEDGVE